MKKIRKPGKKDKRFFFIEAMGCPKNLVEAEVVAGSLITSGYGISFDPDKADVYIICTCGFLPSARNEAAESIANAVAWKAQKPKRTIAVAGCLLNHAEIGNFKQHFPEVDLWVPVNDTARIPGLLNGGDISSDSNGITFLADENHVRMQFTLPHVAYLKISDGCNNRCAYCAIPSLRGALRSRNIAGIVTEAKQLIANGVKELVVIAQDLTAFGQDHPEKGENAAKLLRALDSIEGEFVLRLLYTHPAHYTEEFIDAVAESSHILPYLDMPLQHISDRILKAMNRHIDRSGIEELLTRLRKRIPGLTLRTTFITGLPGETDGEFEELYQFAKKWKFDRFGVFSYAPEPGTPAAEMPDQIPVEIADARAKKLLNAQISRMKRQQKKLVGTTVKAIFDYVDEESGWGIARSASDAPDIDSVIYFEPDEIHLPGDFITLEINGAAGTDLTAVIVQ
ncbi:MAG: 30S ribosomal protein S12 methylthiotransferase RimO [Lentisphaerae bacterium]|nr:30S ribosomal protein S12 methylthiotransferase RimO [Lentisphaerota bacterium]